MVYPKAYNVMLTIKINNLETFDSVRYGRKKIEVRLDSNFMRDTYNDWRNAHNSGNEYRIKFVHTLTNQEIEVKIENILVYDSLTNLLAANIDNIYDILQDRATTVMESMDIYGQYYSKKKMHSCRAYALFISFDN